MVLEVLFFGISSDLVGEKNISFSLSQNSSVLYFKEQLQRQYPKLSQINSYAIAVNKNYATNETLLKENDVVAIIPPVSGG
jgi:molybdopterin synthase sulfur carrier subunit